MAAGTAAAEGMRLWPDDARFVHLRGLAYFRLGNLTAAQQDLLQTQKMAPTDTDAVFDLGLVYMAQRQYEDAARQFETTLKDPKKSGEGISHVMLGRAYQNSNRSEAAIEQFKSALQVEPNIELGHYHLGFAYESLGRNQEALSEYEKELARTQHSSAKENAEVYYQYGNVLAEVGRFNDALVPLGKALVLKPGHADAQYELGKCLLNLGRTEVAVTALKRSAELAPESPNPQYLLSRALAKLGDKDGAKQALDRFLTLKKAQKDSGGMATGRIR